MDSFIVGEFLDQILNLRQHAVTEREEPAAHLKTARADDPDFSADSKQQMMNSEGELDAGIHGDRVRSQQGDESAFSTDIEDSGR